MKEYTCGICETKYKIKDHKPAVFKEHKLYSWQQLKLCPKCDKRWIETHDGSEVYVSEDEKRRVKEYLDSITTPDGKLVLPDGTEVTIPDREEIKNIKAKDAVTK